MEENMEGKSTVKSCKSTIPCNAVAIHERWSHEFVDHLYMSVRWLVLYVIIFDKVGWHMPRSIVDLLDS